MDAIELVKTKRKQIRPNDGFLAQLWFLLKKYQIQVFDKFYMYNSTNDQTI